MKLTATSNATREVATVESTATLEPWEPFSYLPTEMAGRDLSEFKDAWKTYENAQFGFSFTYPAIYDEVSFCKINEKPTDHGGVRIQLGTRIQVIVEPIGKSSTREYIDDLTQSMQYVEIIPTPVAGRDGYYVTYRYGSLGRLDQVYVVDIDSWRVTFEVTGPTGCDFWEVGIYEFEAFNRILRNFSFSR